MININNTAVIIEIYQNKTFILLLKLTNQGHSQAKIVMKNHFGMFHSRLPLYRPRTFKSQTARRKAKKKINNGRKKLELWRVQ